MSYLARSEPDMERKFPQNLGSDIYSSMKSPNRLQSPYRQKLSSQSMQSFIFSDFLDIYIFFISIKPHIPNLLLCIKFDVISFLLLETSFPLLYSSSIASLPTPPNHTYDLLTTQYAQLFTNFVLTIILFYSLSNFSQEKSLHFIPTLHLQ